MSDSQMIIKFENLPNEILLECFNYFHTLDLRHSFGQLNHRLEQLIQTLPWRLDFENIKRETYDAFCQDMLFNPDTQQRIYSLRLSNRNTPGLINDFFSKFSLDQFSHLRSVTFLNLPRSESKALRKTLPKLSQITALYIHDSDIRADRLKYLIPIGNLQTLSMHSELHFVNRTIPIKILTLKCLSLNDICRLFQYTPLLRYFKASLIREDSFKVEYHQSSRPSHLTQLNLGCFTSNFDDLIHFVQNMSNLRSFTVHYGKDKSVMDASRWEELITSFLPNLRDFRFTLSLRQQLDKRDALAIFDRFQTNFWHKEHQWYTRYRMDTEHMTIETRPHVTDCEDICLESKKTRNLLIEKWKAFKPVQLVLHVSAGSSLKLRDFSHLKHLEISSDCRSETQSQLFEILDQAPQLSSLSTKECFFQSLPKNPESHRYLNGKIRILDLKKDTCAQDCQQRVSISFLYQVLPDIEQLTMSDISIDDLFFLLNRFSKLSLFRVHVSSFNLGYERFKMQALEQNVLFDEEKREHGSVYLGAWIRRDTLVTKSEDSWWSLSHIQYEYQRFKEQLNDFLFLLSNPWIYRLDLDSDSD